MANHWETLYKIQTCEEEDNFFQQIAHYLGESFQAKACLFLCLDLETGELVTNGNTFVQDESLATLLNQVENPFQGTIPTEGLLLSQEEMQQRYGEFLQQYPVTFAKLLIYPIVDVYGEVTDYISLFLQEYTQVVAEDYSFLKVLCNWLTQRQERQEAENLILQASEEVDSFSSSLKEIHRLTSSQFEQLEDMYREYLTSGAKVLAMTSGLLVRYETNGKLLLASFGRFSREECVALLVQENFFAEAAFQEQTTQSETLSNIATPSKHIQSWIASPIQMHNKPYGLLCFFDDTDSKSIFEEFEIEFLEMLSHSIASEIERRTSLEKIQKLKKQQDGDYFLTSLLLRPLLGAQIANTQIDIQQLTVQKKSFQFKQWTSSLGGDLCIAETIQLSGKSYSVFVNADAMGKSMQGAGGALVFGSILKSIIERTKIAIDYKSLSPERWIKLTFVELQKVFKSFDGSMMMSAFLGLIDNECGIMYYINAEHPLGVLYRDGQASFFGKDTTLLKIGTPGSAEDIRVHILQLYPDDKVILGSDGRDDILLALDDTGHRIINEDETLFLTVVEKSQAGLEQMLETIHSYGELSDDLSLLLINYKGSPHRKNIYQLSSNEFTKIQKVKKLIEQSHIEKSQMILADLAQGRSFNKKIWRLRIQLFFLEKNYRKVTLLCEEYLQHVPQDDHILLIYSMAYKLQGNYSKALEPAERLHIRQPMLLQNLIHLANLHYLVKNHKRALAMLETANSREPNHPAVLKLAQAITISFSQQQGST
ncbi:MAG: SpoIIE family protein phosphatase [Spirochaetota bacterium]